MAERRTMSGNSLPLVSVITPVYNAGPFLKATLDSILNQTYRNFELLIIDDCSTDDSLSIIDSYGKDPRVRCLPNARNCGAGGSRNRGIENARGKYLVFCDADDVMHPERLQKQVRFMESHPEVDVCGSFVDLINENGEKIGKYTFAIGHDQIKVDMFLRCAFLQSTAMIRRTSFLQSGLCYATNHYAEDFDLWARGVQCLTFHNLPEMLTQYRISSTQLTSVASVRQREDALRVYAGMMERLGVAYNEHILLLHYELAHKKGIRIPAEWIGEYRSFCKACLASNKERRIYSCRLFERAIRHNYKKALYYKHNKVLATIISRFAL